MTDILMEFQTKIVEKMRNPRARVAFAGIALLVLAIIFAFIKGYEQATMWTFGIGMVVFAGGAIYARGDLSHTRISATDLVVNVGELRIGSAVYPIGQVEGLEFLVDGYDGMYVEGSGNNRSRGRTYSGMDNYVSFGYAGEKVECRFYLSDARHVQLLGGVFKEFYAKRVPFTERDNAGWRTFLFEPVTDREWGDRMIENGYK
jgi:uncharacterized membrane protein YgdD (TMEM256/DUF423 family)